MDEKKVIKDFNSLVKFRLSVFIIIIILMTIVVPLYWVYIFTRKRKAKPIIRNNTVTGNPANKDAPFLTIGELDDNQPSNGYSFSGLGQPCINSSQSGGLPNLPGAFTPQPCDTNAGLQCVKGVFDGDICLSQIGFFCDSVNDCVPEADACFNNICSRQGDTLNQRCNNDDDCQVLIDYNLSENIQAKLYNHVCQRERGKNFGYCKVNLFPYDNGCNSNSECLGDEECATGIGKFASDIIVTSGGVSFTLIDKIFWQDITGSVVQLFDSSDNSKGLYQVSNFDTSTRQGNLILTSTTAPNLLKTDSYFISLGQGNNGICLKKIPKGGPANLTLGGVSIPCQDGTKRINNFCLDSITPDIGQVCVNGIVDCPEKVLDNGINVKTACLYNDSTEQVILNDYYFNLNPDNFAEYKLGNCTVPAVGKEQLCDNEWFGCSGPFICIQENSQNGTPVSICNVPFQAQICFNGQCPDGYTCDNTDNRPPLCLGNKNAICITDDDCKSGQCPDSYSIKVFDPASSKIISNYKVDIPSIINDNIKLNLYQPGLCASTFPYSKNLVVPTKRLCWFQTDTSKYVLNIIDSTDITKSIYINTPTNYEIKDIIMDEDENYLIFYKRPVIDTMRKRSFPIVGVSTSDANKVRLVDYNGLAVYGAKAYYVSTSGDDLIPPDKIYNLKIDSIDPLNSYFYVVDENNNNVTINKSAFNNGKHYFVTYDNEYSFYVDKNDRDGPYNLSSSYDIKTGNETDQFKAGDLIYYNNVNSQGPPASFYSTTVYQDGIARDTDKGVSLVENKPYYIMPIGTGTSGSLGVIENWVFKTGISPKQGTEYIISEGYYHATGGYPIMDNYKVINQNLKPDSINTDYYFKLNAKGFYTYGIASFDPSNYKSEESINLESNFDYIYDQTGSSFSINGINQGITYLYNNIEDDIKINSKKINNKNYLIINKGLCYAPEYNNTRNINQFIQLEYNISKDDNINSYSYNKNNFDNALVTTVGISRSIVAFNIVKTIAQNQSKGFYYSDITNGENNIDYIDINNNDSIFYTLINNNKLNNKSENSIAINSKYEKIAYVKNTNYQPELQYSDFSNFENLKPLPFSPLVNINDRKNNENYFIEGENIIYIYDQTDIDNILNFSSSELVLSKEGTSQNYPGKDNTVSFNYTNQITWCLVNILEYEVNMDTEYLKIKIQVPINSEDTETKNIIYAKTNWELNVYNFVKLNYFSYNKLLGGAFDYYLYQISDASLLFCGSKDNQFYKDFGNDSGFARTGYNNIMIKTTGKNNQNDNNTLSTPGNTYSIYKLTDGAGAQITKKINTEEFYSSNYSPENGSSFYQNNAVVSFLINDYSYNYDNVDIIRPSFMDYQFSLSRDKIYPFQADNIINTPYTVDNIINTPLTRFNSFSGSRYFVCFYPLTNNQVNVLITLSLLSFFSPIPLSDTRDSGFFFKNINPEDNKYSQFILDTKNITTVSVNNVSYVLRKLYGGTISLPYTNYADNLYAVNDLFASSLPLGDTFFINSSPIEKDNIVPTVAYDKDGNIIIKNLGNIPLFQTHMAHYQTGTNKKADYFNQSNQVAISFPKWLKARYVSRANQIPKIRKIIIDNNHGNNYANATYYAFIEYIEDNINKTSLVYLDAENTNFTLAENQGVPTTKSIFEDGDKLLDVVNGFAMSGSDKLLYILSKTCN